MQPMQYALVLRDSHVLTHACFSWALMQPMQPMHKLVASCVSLGVGWRAPFLYQPMQPMEPRQAVFASGALYALTTGPSTTSSSSSCRLRSRFLPLHHLGSQDGFQALAARALHCHLLPGRFPFHWIYIFGRRTEDVHTHNVLTSPASTTTSPVMFRTKDVKADICLTSLLY